MLSTRQAHLVRIHEAGGGQYTKKRERKNETRRIGILEKWNAGILA
jgi:hypothetical protein